MDLRRHSWARPWAGPSLALAFPFPEQDRYPFGPIGWNALSGGSQRGIAMMRLHVVTACGDGYAEAFALADRVTEALLFQRGDGWVLARHAESATQAERSELTDCTETFEARFLLARGI